MRRKCILKLSHVPGVVVVVGAAVVVVVGAAVVVSKRCSVKMWEKKKMRKGLVS